MNNNSQKKTNIDNKISKKLQQIANQLNLLSQQSNNKESKENSKYQSESDLKINVRFSTQKGLGIPSQITVKTLTITWRDDQKYENFRRYNLTESKLKQEKQKDS